MAVAVSRRGLRRGTLLVHVVLWFALAFFVIPIVWSVSASLKGRTELFATYPTLFPHQPTLTNYFYAVTRIGPFTEYFLNSVIVTAGAVSLIVMASSLAGYAFGRLRFRWRDLIFYSLVVQLFLPRAGGLMALYEEMHLLGLRNSLPGLVLLFSGGLAVPIFIMRQTYFNIPGEFEDAAAIDGASRWQTFWNVIAPMGTAGMVLVAIFTFIEIWGEFLVTLTMIDDPDKFTLALGVANLQLGTTSWVDADIIPYGTEAAAYILTALPCVIVFILLQKWFVRGLTEGLKF
jgi:ABC-type glycerol-3-phosphate transport system permease component